MSSLESQPELYRELRGAGLPLNIHSAKYEASRVVTSGPSALYGFTVYSSNVAAQWIQIFDASQLPSNGAIPAAIFKVAAASSMPINYIPPRMHQVGIVICNSTTGPTLTIGAADCFFDVQFA